ncbi:MAG: TolC family protein [Verrucomicrobia bacterium]|nr:TolC family protein [Verrucomicrobiota bacterium]MBV8275223.1 TolC family protein [Verrucomicrobiota bacterium]
MIAKPIPRTQRNETVFGTGIACALALCFLMASTTAGAKDSAPPSPDRPWSPPDLAAHQAQLQNRHVGGATDAEVDHHKVYHLPELIDLAERLNPDTKVAWQRAKQALAAVGLQEVNYYPILSAAAASGYTRLFAPLPSLNINRAALVRAIETGGPASSAISLQSDGVLHLDLLGNATLSLKWLLFDFGERAAAVRVAREELLVANLGFNATHQKLVFEVSKNYYTYNDQRDAVRVAHSALDTSTSVNEAVEARFKVGLATQPEVLQAKQQLAQSQFDLQKALGSQTDSLVDLLIGIGLSPSIKIKIADDFTGSLPTDVETPLNELVDHALVNRPDMVAAIANIRAKEAAISAIKASYYPKVSSLASIGYGQERLSLHTNTFDSGAPTFGAGLAVEVPIFDGFLRRRQLDAAESALGEANSQLKQSGDRTEREVWQAYTDLHTAINSESAADALEKASQESYDAVIASYKQGFSTYTEVVTNETRLTNARNALFQSRSAIHTAATALALALGDLAQPEPSPTMTRTGR